MTPQEYCESAEHSLAKAGEFLLKPTPGSLEECLQLLNQVAASLEALAKAEKLAKRTSLGWDPAVTRAIYRIQASARALGQRIEHGSKLVRGWMQLRLGEGYTRGGLPTFMEPPNERHLEA